MLIATFLSFEILYKYLLCLFRCRIDALTVCPLGKCLYQRNSNYFTFSSLKNNGNNYEQRICKAYKQNLISQFLNSYCHCMHVVSYQLLCLLFSCGVNFYFIILLKVFFMRYVSRILHLSAKFIYKENESFSRLWIIKILHFLTKSYLLRAFFYKLIPQIYYKLKKSFHF